MSLISEGVAAQQPMVLILVTLLVVLVTTKVISGGPATFVKDGKHKTPPVASHWVPALGNLPSMLVGRESFLAGLRDRYDGIFSLTLLGKTHHFVYKPSLVTALFNTAEDDDDQTMKRLLNATFGVPVQDLEGYTGMQGDVRAQYSHLLLQPGLGEVTGATVRLMQQQIANLVTFNSHPADQTEWERAADADVVALDDNNSRGKAVEADLMQLIRTFVAKTATAAMFGSDFVANLPDVFELLWVFDSSQALLTAGWPVWVPFPRLQRGRTARRRILGYLREFHEALETHLAGGDAGPRWQGLDDVSRLVRGRAETFRRGGMSLQGRAGWDLALLWRVTAQVNPLIAWMLFEVYRDPVLLEQVREEVAPHVRAVQPRNEFGPAVWLAPELAGVDVEGLLGCWLTRAAYVETLRVYNSGRTVRWLQRDTVLEDGDGGGYWLDKGACVHFDHEMHQMDPEYFPEPREWRACRHVEEVEEEEGLGTLRPYGGGVMMCKGREFALREMMLYVAAIVTLYDMQPAGGGSWETPQTVRYSGVRYPKKAIRVWIKRREAPGEVVENTEI